MAAVDPGAFAHGVADGEGDVWGAYLAEAPARYSAFLERRRLQQQQEAGEQEPRGLEEGVDAAVQGEGAAAEEGDGCGDASSASSGAASTAESVDDLDPEVRQGLDEAIAKLMSRDSGREKWRERDAEDAQRAERAEGVGRAVRAEVGAGRQRDQPAAPAKASRSCLRAAFRCDMLMTRHEGGVGVGPVAAWRPMRAGRGRFCKAAASALDGEGVWRPRRSRGCLEGRCGCSSWTCDWGLHAHRRRV